MCQSPSFADQLLSRNCEWSEQVNREQPELFRNLAQEQHPKAFWIGCSDSRISPPQITNSEAGELFVHRNIANLAIDTDLNLLSALTYAIEGLEVEHLIVCGHFGCGGVHAATAHHNTGSVIDYWVSPIFRLSEQFRILLDATPPQERLNKLVKLNVVQQVTSLASMPVVRKAWESGRKIQLHGWVYDLECGQINVLLDHIDGYQSLDGLLQRLDAMQFVHPNGIDLKQFIDSHLSRAQSHHMTRAAVLRPTDEAEGLEIEALLDARKKTAYQE